VIRRPYDGARWSIATGATLIGLLWRRGFVTRLLLPASAVLALTAAWIAYYDFRVTGDPLLLPDQLHTRQYMAVPRFYWSAPEPPKTYHNDAMRDHYDRYEREYFETQQTPRGWITWFLREKLYKFVKFYLLRSLFLTIGLLVLPFAIKRAYAQNHSGWWVQRTQLEKSLVSSGARHLIIARYGPDHISGNEWVFNHADIMSAPVVWARELPDMSPLLARFRD